MNRKEAAKFLEITERTLHRHTEAGRINAKRGGGKGARLEYDLADLERLKAILKPNLIQGEVEEIAPEPEPLIEDSTAIEVAPQPELPFEYSRTSLKSRLLLNLTECSYLTGLEESLLVEAAENGELTAVFHGGAWRVQPEGLKVYITGLFKPVRSLPPSSHYQHAQEQEWLTELAALVQTFLDSAALTRWHGTATELLALLSAHASETMRDSRKWPSNATRLGILLNRAVPNLRAIGVEITRFKDPGGGARITHLEYRKPHN
jgi:hypothetical protein